jgi:formate hydrogenlyase subunit 6/NADH:ubiquinone oxidoreductase subunit I
MRVAGKIAKLLIQSLFKKPATGNYPFDQSGMPAGFRGKLKFYHEKCIGCKFCMRDCPSGAIEIHKTGDKEFEAKMDLARCIYCGQCLDSCPKNALESTSEFELARLGPDQLKIVLNVANKKNPE